MVQTLKEVRDRRRLIKAAKRISSNPDPDFLVIAGPNDDGKFTLSTNMHMEVAIELIRGAFNGKTPPRF